MWTNDHPDERDGNQWLVGCSLQPDKLGSAKLMSSSQTQSLLYPSVNRKNAPALNQICMGLDAWPTLPYRRGISY